IGIEPRRAHVDAHPAVGLQPRSDHPRKRLDADLALFRQPFVVNEPDEAARAVAALLDLTAVRVPDAVAEIRVRSLRFLHDQDLVAAYPEVAVGDAPRALRVDVDFAAEAVENDEVVARALHLGEFQAQLKTCIRRSPR